MASIQQAPRVLVVDDGTALRGLLCDLLKKEGFNVVGDLEHAAAVLQTIEQTHPDLVCLDYNLPDGDGLTLLRRIHQLHPDIAVIMITGTRDPGLHAEAAEAGVAGFLHKPFSPLQIVRELRHVLHARRLMAGLFLAQALDSPIMGKRVLIADDSGALRHLLRMIVSESGMTVVGEAANGREAISLAVAQRPDLVCLDVNMPLMGGLEALYRIRQAAPGLAVMMITAHADRTTVLEAAKHGARGYLLKPYQPENVVKALEGLFST